MSLQSVSDCFRKKAAAFANTSTDTHVNPFVSPNVRSLILFRRGSNPVCVRADPDPLIALVTQQDVVRFRQVANYTAQGEDLSVKGISRVDFNQQFIDDLTGVIVDGQLNEAGTEIIPDVGQTYAIQAFSEATTITWDLIIRKKTLSR